MKKAWNIVPVGHCAGFLRLTRRQTFAILAVGLAPVLYPNFSEPDWSSRQFGSLFFPGSFKGVA